MTTTIYLDAVEVLCMNETGATSWGSDEISLGGYGIDANLEVTKIAPINVQSGFDSRERKTYNPPRQLVALTLGANRQFPKAVSVGLLLFERDAGDGRVEITQKACEAAQAEADKQKALTRAADGTVVIVVAETILAAIAASSADDVFPLVTLNLEVPSAQFSFDGSMRSPVFAAEFRGHGGLYILKYAWRLS